MRIIKNIVVKETVLCWYCGGSCKSFDLEIVERDMQRGMAKIKCKRCR